MSETENNEVLNILESNNTDSVANTSTEENPSLDEQKKAINLTDLKYVKKYILDQVAALKTEIETTHNTDVETLNNKIDTLNIPVFDDIYPVGSIYMSTDNANPSTKFGGTWVAWGQGKVPVGVGTFTYGTESHNKPVSGTTDHLGEITGSQRLYTASGSFQVDGTGEVTNITITSANAVDKSVTYNADTRTISWVIKIATGNTAVNGIVNYVTPKTDTRFATVEATGGEVDHTLTVDELAKHSHVEKVDLSNDAEEYAISTAGPAAKTYKVFNSTSKSVSSITDGYTVIPVTTEEAGGGQAHNNLQPYITCYMWKRTA